MRITQLRGWYLPTAKNAPVKDCYRQHDFTLAEQTPEGGELWTIDLPRAAIAVPTWLTVHVLAPVA